MARASTQRHSHAEPKTTEQPANIETVEFNEFSVGSVLSPISTRRQRVAIDLRSESSSLTLSVTGPATIDISG